MNTKKYLVLAFFTCTVGLLLFSWSAKGQVLALSGVTVSPRSTMIPRNTSNDIDDHIASSSVSKEQIRIDAQKHVQEMKNLKEDFKNKVEAAREEMKQKIDSAQAAFKTRLQSIKDLNKRTIVERIDGSLNKLNSKLLDHYSEVLDKLEKILDRINEKAKTDSEKGLDTTAVNIAITTATEKIELARTAIETQSSKTYPITITAENKLKVDIGAVRKALHDDLVIVRNAVKSAREAVHAAAVALGQLHGIKPTPTPTLSPSTTPTPSVS